tara:strand:+ start:2151 stop:2642 length:492 start_codon:yes stop_codon:yes gene_type:complete
LALPLLVLLSINQYLLALILLIIGGLTDLFDGLIARRLEGCSVWGAKMDPLADKFFLFGPLIWLGSEGLIPLWSLWLIIVRDFTVSIWRQEEKKGAPATSIGKLKTTLQFISIMLLIISQSIYEAQIYEYILVIGITTFWFSFGLSLISSYNYFRNQTMNYRD